MSFDSELRGRPKITNYDDELKSSIEYDARPIVQNLAEKLGAAVTDLFRIFEFDWGDEEK